MTKNAFQLVNLLQTVYYYKLQDLISVIKDTEHTGYLNHFHLFV